MRHTQNSKRPNRQMHERKLEQEDADSSCKINSGDFAANCKNNENNKKFALNSGYIKNENDIDFEMVLDNSILTAKKIRLDDKSATIEEMQKTDFTKREFPVSMQESKKENHNLNNGTAIKIEKDSEFEDKPNVSGKKYANMPVHNHISVGEIKIEDGIFNKANVASEEESSENETHTDYDDAGTTSTKVIYAEDCDDVGLSSGEGNSSAVSKWNEEDDDIPTTSQKIKKEKPDFKAKMEQGLQIKKEEKNEPDSDNEDMDIPSGDEEEFLSDDSGGEEFLSDGDENSSDNQSLTVDNKPVVSQLIDEYHKRPLLWFKELSTEMSDVKQLELFRSINLALNKKFNKKFNVNRIKSFLKSLCAQYETEIERQLKENEETTADSSSLWFYDKLFFLKDDIEDYVKLKLEKSLEVLDDNILAHLIDFYKNHEALWNTNHPLFPHKKKRHEAMQYMCREIKNRMNISLNTFKLEYQLSNLHKKFKEDKKKRFHYEKKEIEYKPPSSLISKCEFLENHQAPFKCHTCQLLHIQTLTQFIKHKAQHDGTNPFKCNTCGEAFKNRDQLDYHSYQHNGIDYNCSICGKKFRHPSVIKLHIKRIHISLPEEKKEKLLKELNQCKICGKTFIRLSNLKNHIYKHDGKEPACSICGKKFTSPTDIKRHITLSHTFNCKACGEVCSDMKSFNQHIASHEGKQFICDICGQGFIAKKDLDRHKSTDCTLPKRDPV